MRLSWLMFGCLLASGLAYGQSTPPVGVWSGTLGNKAVMACFNQGDALAAQDDIHGNYYYLDYLTPISLRRENSAAAWHEAQDTGVWVLDNPKDARLNGTWHHPKNTQTLPIQLRLLDTPDHVKACGQDAYHQPLEAMPSVIKGDITAFAPLKRYRSLRFANQETVQLFADAPGIASINAQLKLDKSEQALTAYFSKVRESLTDQGRLSLDENAVHVRYWDDYFISIEFYTWRAGYGRSGISVEHRVWNTTTGEEVNLWHWLASSSRETGLGLQFKQHLFNGQIIDEECEYYEGQDDFKLELSDQGLLVYEEAWGTGCEQSFTVSFAELLNFASPSGKVAIQQLLR